MPDSSWRRLSQHPLGRQTTPVQFGRINYRYCSDLVRQGLSEPMYSNHKPISYSSVIIPLFSLLPESNVVFFFPKEKNISKGSYFYHKTSFFGKEIQLKDTLNCFFSQTFSLNLILFTTAPTFLSSITCTTLKLSIFMCVLSAYLVSPFPQAGSGTVQFLSAAIAVPL